LRKSRFFAFWRQTDRQTNKQTDKQTDEQMDSIDALSSSRCRERRLNKKKICSARHFRPNRSWISTFWFLLKV